MPQARATSFVLFFVSTACHTATPVSEVAYGEEEHPRLPSLIQALTAEHARDRIAAAEQIGELGLEARAAIPELILALTDADDAVKAAALGALADLGQATPEVTASVRRLLNHDTWFVREGAEAALSRLDRAMLEPRLASVERAPR